MVPHPIIANYRAAFTGDHSLTYRVIEGADHASFEPAVADYLHQDTQVVGSRDDRGAWENCRADLIEVMHSSPYETRPTRRRMDDKEKQTAKG